MRYIVIVVLSLLSLAAFADRDAGIQALYNGNEVKALKLLLPHSEAGDKTSRRLVTFIYDSVREQGGWIRLFENKVGVGEIAVGRLTIQGDVVEYTQRYLMPIVVQDNDISIYGREPVFAHLEEHPNADMRVAWMQWVRQIHCQSLRVRDIQVTTGVDEQVGDQIGFNHQRIIPADVPEEERAELICWLANADITGNTQEPEKADQPDDKAPIVTGTGFFINVDGYIVTNYHVVDGCVSPVIEVGKDDITSVVSATDPENDLALLKIDKNIPEAITVREYPAKIGESVYVVGFPYRGFLADRPVLTSGSLSSDAGPGNDASIVQISAPIQSGTSGSPLMDKGGRLVGVVVAKLDAIKFSQVVGDLPQNVNFAINAETVRAFLDANDIRYDSSDHGPALDGPEIYDKAREWVVPIECHTS